MFNRGGDTIDKALAKRACYGDGGVSFAVSHAGGRVYRSNGPPRRVCLPFLSAFLIPVLGGGMARIVPDSSLLQLIQLLFGLGELALAAGFKVEVFQVLPDPDIVRFQLNHFLIS